MIKKKATITMTKGTSQINVDARRQEYYEAQGYKVVSSSQDRIRRKTGDQ